MPATRRIRIHGPQRPATEGDIKIALTLRFNPDELGAEKTAKLLGGLVAAVAEVVTPAERAEMLRQFDAEQTRLARSV